METIVASFTKMKPFVFDENHIKSQLSVKSFVIWHDIYREVLNLNPEYTESSILRESNKCASYFLKNKLMSRETKLDILSLSSPSKVYAVLGKGVAGAWYKYSNNDWLSPFALARARHEGFGAISSIKCKQKVS